MNENMKVYTKAIAGISLSTDNKNEKLNRFIVLQDRILDDSIISDSDKIAILKIVRDYRKTI